MEIMIAARKVTLKDSFKERVQKKLGKYDKFFSEDAQAKVTVTVEKNRQTVEVTIRDGGMIFRVEETASEMEDALDRISDVLIRQIHKNKSRLGKRLRSSAFENMNEYVVPIEEETEFRVVRNKKFSMKPMDVDEAILQMNMLGHQFYMFQNIDTDEINVVYKRKNGDYGLIEPDRA